MLNASDAVIAALNDFETVLFVTITIDWPTAAGGTERLTDYPFDTTVGGQIYQSAAGILNYSRPSARSVISRNDFSLELENNDNRRNSQINAAQSGVPITVFLNFQDPNTGAYIGNIEMYNGISSSAQITAADNGQVLRVNFTGQLNNLNEINGRYTTTASQQAVDPTDTSMDYAHDPDGELSLLWGRT